jgi:hypothetical protein
MYFLPKIKAMNGERYKMVMEENLLIPFLNFFTERRPSCSTAPPATLLINSEA